MTDNPKLIHSREAYYWEPLILAASEGKTEMVKFLLEMGADPNTSPDRRIGLTVAYMSAESRYIGEGPAPEYALVCGRAFPGCV